MCYCVPEATGPLNFRLILLVEYDSGVNGMSTPQDELTEKLKSLSPAKPTSFTPEAEVPTLTTSTAEPPPDAVVVNESAKEVTEKKSVTDLSPEVKAQIRRNIEANAALNNKKIEFDNDFKVLQVLKDCGMDTQMAERALVMLKGL
jgi:hypothetical protein